MAKLSVTAGEQLLDFVAATVHDFREFIGRFGPMLTVTRRTRHFSDYFHWLLALSITTRLIRFARFVIDVEPEIDDKMLRLKVMDFARDKLLIHAANCDDTDELAFLTIAAARKSGRDVTKGLKSAIKLQIPNPSCYLCGIALTYNLDQGNAKCGACDRPMPNPAGIEIAEFEHVWPAAYGGDTDARNLLPACRWCNREKSSLTSWQWANIASTLLRHMPTPEEWKQLRRGERIALTMRVAWDLAAKDGLSLREAVLKAGPYQKEFSLIDVEDSSDFFNIQTHDLEALGLDWSLG